MGHTCSFIIRPGYKFIDAIGSSALTCCPVDIVTHLAHGGVYVVVDIEEGKTVAYEYTPAHALNNYFNIVS